MLIMEAEVAEGVAATEVSERKAVVHQSMEEVAEVLEGH